MEEIWKTIEDYPNYMISNMGRIKSVWFGKERLLRLIMVKGYLMVNLCKNGKGKKFQIHRLVAQAFIPNPDNLPQVNHKDENPKNNCVENLEWCNAKYNANYGNRIDKIKEKIKKPVLQFDNEGNLVQKWDSATTASKTLKIFKTNISNCMKGRRYKTTGGYKWGYIDDYERIPFKVFDLDIYKKKVG